MHTYSRLIILSFVSFLLFTSCKAPQLLLKKEAKIETLNLELDLRVIQEFEYRQEILKKMTKFVEVYNSEAHPFKLSLNSGARTASCHVKLVMVKFVHTKQNVLGTVVTAAGIGTAAALISAAFPVPFGWVYIPAARTTMTPTLSNDITDVENFQRVGISSVGMYRKMNRQIDKQSTKFVKYMVSVVQTIEEEYKTNNQQ